MKLLPPLLIAFSLTLPATAVAQLQLKNVAAVLVTAQLPAFAQPGQSIDVNVSSMGNAKSIKGGTLITTPLKGADGEIYALAQGNLIVAGAGASAGGSKLQVNHLSAGRIPGGAQVERAVASPLQMGDNITLNLDANDFQTARKVAQVINSKMGEGTARALDGRTVQVKAPADADAPAGEVAATPRGGGRAPECRPRPLARGAGGGRGGRRCRRRRRG